MGIYTQYFTVNIKVITSYLKKYSDYVGSVTCTSQSTFVEWKRAAQTVLLYLLLPFTEEKKNNHEALERQEGEECQDLFNFINV